MSAFDAIQELKQQMCRSVLGQDVVIERLIIALLANGNVLLEGLPGLAKTRAVKCLAGIMDAGLSRIQFTPDLLPADITGTEIYHYEGGHEKLQFQPGPIINNLILADEINRAPAKVQAALLEAMEERQVTVAGKTYPLPDLFMVLATQNPIDQEGTYPLPEAQMDRFLLHVNIDYPDAASELDMIRLVRSEEQVDTSKDVQGQQVMVSQESIFEARSQIQQIHVSESIEHYIVNLITATRNPERFNQDLAQWIEVGASPRGSIALDKCARSHAWLQGRDYVEPDDVRAVAHDSLRHRIIPSYEANAEGKTSQMFISEIIKLIAVA